MKFRHRQPTHLSPSSAPYRSLRVGVNCPSSFFEKSKLSPPHARADYDYGLPHQAPHILIITKVLGCFLIEVIKRHILPERDHSFVLTQTEKNCSQANRINRAKQKMPHMGGSKSIATFMNEKEMTNERMCNSERFTEQPPRSVAWEGDVYSQNIR
ncbi:uncharacterized protein LOC107825631 isoform X3 [Nicotiana tabacum]|uniref:Uncharacterized protein LOC107825631 isoform X3 n=1 Tax=Nicotiana tabacum TaxID=4097 RepID=A0AC58UUS4_TOBAC